MQDADIKQRLEVAIAAAHEAGLETLKYFGSQTLQFERKSDDSPVTVADRQAEQLLRKTISDKFPDDGILGEEFGEQAGNSGFRWILDPIDGTKSFISGVPLYGTLIGVEHDQRSLIGVIHIPGLGETVYAASGQGAWYTRADNPPREARVSEVKSLADGLFVTSQVDSYSTRGADQAYRALERSAYITRTWGDCYGYLLVATGRAEVMIDPVMSIWDAAAIEPVLQEAGGCFVDWRGQSTIYSGEGIGCNRHVLDEVLAITRQYPQPS